VGEAAEPETDHPALGVGSRGDAWGRSVVDGPAVAVEGIGDVSVSCVVVGTVNRNLQPGTVSPR
ncbi:MAG TPA: hypothetical protein PKX97_04925, partial [Microthrixaceae bacterium]|nr:hypothetical protein [Microthrixaceae bacterium]